MICSALAIAAVQFVAYVMHADSYCSTDHSRSCHSIRIIGCIWYAVNYCFVIYWRLLHVL